MAPSAVEIQWLGPAKGFGLLAKQAIAKGDTILTEAPIVCAQYLYNRHFFPACSHCMKSLETPVEMLRRLSGVSSLSDSDMPLIEGSCSILPCHECGDRERYCSEACRRQAWIDYHQRLCVGKNPSVHQDMHPILQLEDLWRQMNPPPETSTIMLVARMVAMIGSRLDQGQTLEEAASLFLGMKHDAKSESLQLLHRLFEGDLEAQLQTTHAFFQQIFADDLRLSPVTSMEGFCKLLCAMALNGQGVGTSSLEHYQRQLRAIQTEEANAVLDRIESLDEAVEEVSGMFTMAEGSGLYALHSKINHSCVPNAEIQFPFNNATLSVVAKRSIFAGQEILIDYLSEMCCDHDEEDHEDHEEDEDNEDGEMEDVSEEDQMEDCERAEKEPPQEEDMEEDENQESLQETRRDLLRRHYLFECQCEKCA